MKIEQIIPELIVNNIKHMVEFYVKYFDFKVDFVDPEGNDYTWAQLSNNSCTIMLQETEVTKSEISCINEQIVGTDLTMFKFSNSKEVQQFYKRFELNQRIIYMPLRKTEYGSYEFGIKDPEGRFIIVSG